MANLLIDTNILIELYTSAKDNFEAFNRLHRLGEDLLMPDQIELEFERNRNQAISQCIAELKKATQIGKYTTAILRDKSEMAAIEVARKSAIESSKRVIAQLNEMLIDPLKDPVYRVFKAVLATSTRLGATNEILELARIRQLRGMPPTSPRSNTYGDEVIWQTILSNARSDLVVATRDTSYSDNEHLLKKEYSTASKGKHTLLGITNTLNDAMKILGKEPSPLFDLPVSPTDHCPLCQGKLEWTGYEGMDGDEAHWLYCKECGKEFFE